MMSGTMSRTRVHTWADGFGRWYAAVPGDMRDPRGAARRAIRRELEERGDLGAGYVVRLEEAPDEWLTTDRELRPVFREVMQEDITTLDTCEEVRDYYRPAPMCAHGWAPEQCPISASCRA